MNNQIRIKLAVLALAFTAAVPSLHADITLPTTDVSDGALNVASGTTNIIDLRNAILVNNWTNTSPSPGNGVYDPAQWAVVFKYSSVNIASNATVSFINNQTHAPVVWVVNGNVTINGTVNLDGQAGTTDPNNLAEPGPGGFRGGGGPVYGNGPGFGPGGAGSGYYSSGSYSGVYGNPQILPLIGGSGGAGYGNNGGAGGGAILIAATGSMNLTNGNLHATGGNQGGGIGSGGAIRLVAYQISGNASTSITALGGGNNASYVGRIRLEASLVNGSMNINPTTTGVQPDSPVKIFPDTNAPTVTIVNVGTKPVTSDPKAIMSSGVNADDVTLVTTNVVIIQLQTQNFPTNGTVSVYIKPRNSSPPLSPLTATFVSGNTNSALWQVSTTELYPGQAGHTVLQARASF